jgi:hypothetical protein
MAKPGKAIRMTMAIPALLLAACGAGGPAGGQPTPSPAATVTAAPCVATSPSARPPVGATQALGVIPVHVLIGVPASAEVMDLGTALCVNVGVSQRVAVHVHARIPPLPAESRVAPVPLLSAIEVSPAVAAPAGTPQAGAYTLTFTAQRPGSTAITYLPATCALPAGVC